MKKYIHALLPSFLFVIACTVIAHLLLKYCGVLLSGILGEYAAALSQLNDVFIYPSIPVFVCLLLLTALLLANGKYRPLKLMLLVIPCFVLSLLTMNVNGICFIIGLKSVLPLLT